MKEYPRVGGAIVTGGVDERPGTVKMVMTLAPDFKVGATVTVFKVVEFMDDTVKVEEADFVVVGDEAGEPLCLRHDAKGKKGEHERILNSYGSQVTHFHEVSYTAADAVRRWRAAKLVEAVRAEQEAKKLREALRTPIKLKGGIVARPDSANPQLQTWFDDGKGGRTPMHGTPGTKATHGAIDALFENDGGRAGIDRRGEAGSDDNDWREGT